MHKAVEHAIVVWMTLDPSNCVLTNTARRTRFREAVDVLWLTILTIYSVVQLPLGSIFLLLSLLYIVALRVLCTARLNECFC